MVVANGSVNGVTRKNILHTDKKYNFVQCVGCGAVAGVTEGHHITSYVMKIMTKLGIPFT